jgi:recombination protein RecA
VERAGKKSKSLKTQVKEKVKESSRLKRGKEELEGDPNMMISTGSTLLDLALSGGRVRGGGLLAGTTVEIFGPESIGKSVLLSEIAGAIQRQGGEALFNDTESRFDEVFARIFGYILEQDNYFNPNTVTEVFQGIEKWKPKTLDVVNGIITDSLAALSTNLEMDNEEGDKMGMRRGKEFSAGFRKNARLIKKNNYLMVCSNQIRDTGNTFGAKTNTPGGWATRFYSSVRIDLSKLMQGHKLIRKKTIHGKETTRIEGINIIANIVKNSTWKPHRSALITILYDYGIDDIRQNLQFVKDYTDNSVYTINGEELSNKLENAILKVEDLELETELREQVIDLWESIEEKFKVNRKIKKRW